jgi:hypothetical protein
VRKNISILTVFFIFCLVWIFSLDSVSGAVKLQDIRVLYNETDMVVYAVLTDSFTKEMESAILAGVPTTFTFTLETYQERNWWFDKKISRIIRKHTIKFDNVKQTFSVSSTDGREAVIFQDFAEAKRAMSELSGVVLTPITNLVKGKTYYARIKAKLEKFRPPSIMRYIFFFASLGDFETDWSPKQRLLY